MMINEYSNKISKNIDLTSDMQPPKDLYITVRVD